ncbi:MATE family efflux transporter [Frisingicoccus sp.]|uniref:MATE family efflux transporter n=1 Tax=Frisingicoccus sp. TaxID=1918627 RepID=UPI002A820776|nr:MATE family efflux transporter [Frisingicoccus sp.]MDY4922586.1 MATE family efflux transporter [Frisingicoccus sp.]
MIKDLTEGNPKKVLWQFTMPMFVSVIFQQLYNIADSVIAGKFAGENALAAVGASYPITMIFMAIAVGSNIGCAVVISQFFGAKEYGKMKTAVFTTMLSSFVLSVLLMIFGLLGTEMLMKMIHTPSDIFGDGALYLRIYVAGFLFLFLYNVATGIFTSLGDSKTPLYFLIGSSLGNILLDTIFVAVLKWGVAGVAWATFIAQGVACILALITLTGRIKGIETSQPCQIFSWQMLKKISGIAIPSILQQSFVSVGNIFIQSLVNSFGSSVIAGYSAAVKLNTFTITCFSTMGNAVSSFTAQNLGAGKVERTRKGLAAGIKMGLIVALPFFTAFFIFGNNMVQLFMSGDASEVALETGVTFLRIVSPFYFVISIKLLVDGLLRGSGAIREFMAATFTDLILRVLISYILSAFFQATGIWMSWPIGWTIAAIMSVFFYRKGKWAEKYC